MKQYLTDAPEGATVFHVGWNRESVLLFLLYQNMHEFIDWESGTALFDTSDFKALLEFANSIPSDSAPPPYQDELFMLLEGKQLIAHTGILSMESFVRDELDFEGKAVYKGFPSSQKYSGIFYTGEFTIAMSSACEEKDDAWRFIRTALLVAKNFQEIPSLQSKFDVFIQSAMTDLTPKPNRPQMPGSEPRPALPPMTREQYEKLVHVFDGVGTISGTNIAVRTIINEEAPAYFAGDKTVNEVCAIIQSRAQLYVWEQG